MTPTNIALRIKPKIPSSNYQAFQDLAPAYFCYNSDVNQLALSGLIPQQVVLFLDPRTLEKIFPSARNTSLQFFIELTPMYSSVLSSEVWEAFPDYSKAFLNTPSSMLPLKTSPIRICITLYYTCQISCLIPSFKVIGK